MTTVKSAGLSWGQRYFWLHHHQLPAQARHDTHIVLDPPLPEGVPLARIRSVLTYLVRRHEALRTTFAPGADGRPRQWVHPPAPLPVRQATTEADGTPSPAEVVGECTVTGFDLAADWPIRACVVTTGGVPKRLVLVLDHIAFDDWSIDILLRELAALLAAAAAGRPASLPPVGRQPSELAHREAAGAEQLAYWREQVARLPADQFAGRRVPAAEPPASSSASLTSPRLLGAARALAARHRIWPAAVHLAAYAAVTAAWTGGDRVPFWLFTSHRDDEPDPAVLTCMFTPVLLTAELAGDPPFSAVLHRVSEGLATAKRHAAAGYDELTELLAVEGFRRGRPVRVEAEVNVLSYAPRSCGTARTRFAWNREPSAWARSGSDAYFRVYDWADGVTVALRAAGAVMAPDVVERFLRGYEELLVAHADPATDLRAGEIARLLGFPAPRRPDGPAPAAGSPGAAAPPVPGAERALAGAVARANGLDGPGGLDLADSYPVAGGRALHAPGVLALLDEAGWEGLSVRQLTGVQPLRALAGLLTPRPAPADS